MEPRSTWGYATPEAASGGPGFGAEKGFAMSPVKGPMPFAQYPAPIFIRNTFLDSVPNRPSSLEGFFQERDVRSCPVSIDSDTDPTGAALLAAAAAVCTSTSSPSKDEPARVPLPTTPEANCFAYTPERLLLHSDVLAPRKLDSCWNEQAAASVPHGGTTPAGGLPLRTVGATARSVAMDSGALSDDDEADDDDEDEEDESSAAAALPGRVQVLRLADAINQPNLGSAEMPTQGSAGHRVGLCKPCAFLEKGCTSGIDCKFCHLCAPDEKKRRKKEKLALRRQVSRWQRTMTEAISPPPADPTIGAWAAPKFGFFQ